MVSASTSLSRNISPSSTSVGSCAMPFSTALSVLYSKVNLTRRGRYLMAKLKRLENFAVLTLSPYKIAWKSG